MKLCLLAPVLAVSSNIFSDDEQTCIAAEFEQDTTYHMGAQYDIGHVTASDVGDCCSKCKVTSGCQAFTLADGVCWMHKHAGNRAHSKGVISGSVAHLTTTTTTPAPPTPPPTPLAPPTPSPAVTSPVQVFIMMGQSNMLGEGKINGWTEGTLENAVVVKGLYPYLRDDEANTWAQVDHVRNVAVMGGGGATGTIGALHHNEWVSVNPTEKSTIGPDLGIGFTMGLGINGTSAFEAPTMLLKSCIGNRALGWDLLPPGTEQWEYNESGKTYVFAGYGESPARWEKGTEPKPIGWHAGLQYDGDVNRSKLVLEDLATYYPGATSYEVAGFFWWQGDKDMRDPAYYTRYEFNLVNLIKQLRTEFNAPNAKFVTASLGQSVKGSTSGDGQILDAMLAVDGKNGKYPEFEGNVATVYTHPLVAGPGSSSSHYGQNAETYMNIGEAMGLAMLELLKTDSVALV